MFAIYQTDMSGNAMVLMEATKQNSLLLNWGFSQYLSVFCLYLHQFFKYFYMQAILKKQTIETSDFSWIGFWSSEFSEYCIFSNFDAV